MKLKQKWHGPTRRHAAGCGGYLQHLTGLLCWTGTLNPREISQLAADRATDINVSKKALMRSRRLAYALLYDAYSRQAGKHSDTAIAATNVSPAWRPQLGHCDAA